MTPSVKVDLKHYWLGDDDTQPVSDIAHISIDHTYSPQYIIGHSIDDLEGIVPTACIVSVVECCFRFLLVHDLLHGDHVQGDIPWYPGGFKAW
ncbi:hypothetical protein ZWY2020_028529 [Hordeum vulgare]|nr:hypothetical protein ZWY2020_028529 [Hordeum vulgare]